MYLNIRPLFAAAALVLLAGVPATAGTAGPAQPAQAAEDEESFLPSDPLAQRLCEALHGIPEARKAQCCGRAPSSSLADECARTLSDALRDNHLRLDPSGVDRCAEETSKTLAGCDWVTPLAPASPEACGDLLRGDSEAGSACRSSLECRDGLFCRGAAADKAGACAAPGAAGASCGVSADVLAGYTRQTMEVRHPECAGYCLAGRCAAFVALGGSCSSNRQCAPGQYCGQSRCQPGPQPAVALKAAGEPCTSPFECRGACLVPAGAQAGTCGMKCNNWPLQPAQPASRTSASHGGR